MHQKYIPFADGVYSRKTNDESKKEVCYIVPANGVVGLQQHYEIVDINWQPQPGQIFHNDDPTDWLLKY